MIMNKRIWIITAITLVLLTTLACQVSIGNFGYRTVRGSEEVVMEEIDVGNFNSVELTGVGRLTIEIGEEETLVIEAEDNLISEFVNGLTSTPQNLFLIL
jgi:hypothetical protein